MKTLTVLASLLVLQLVSTMNLLDEHQLSGTEEHNDGPYVRGGRGRGGRRGPYRSPPQQHPQPQQNKKSCFPGDALVLEQTRGQIAMSEVKVGDFILAQDPACPKCEPIYTEVTAWLHRSTDEETRYLKIQLQDGHFYVSPYHNIALGDSQYSFANELSGKSLFGACQCNDDSTWEMRRGAYSPLTATRNYYVITSNLHDKVLAHSFANIRNPVFYEPFFGSIIKGWELLNGQPDYQAPGFSVHPAAQFSMKAFSFLLEG